MKEQFLEILESEKDIIPFLKELDKKEKRELVPEIKKLIKKYLKRSVKEGGGYSWGYDFGTDKQRDIIKKSAYVCFNKTDAFKLLDHSFLSISEVYLTNILPWYVPSWYSDSVNDWEDRGIDYLLLMDLKEQKKLKPSSELIVWSVIKDSKNVEKYPETLEKHFWLIFELETNINWINSDIWTKKILLLCETKKINRLTLLKATLNTSSKGFNKVLTGWFTDLFVELEPTEKELVELQEELFSVFDCPHSKYTNEVLKSLKKLCTHKLFDKEGFIEQSSVLLTSATKGIVTSSLMILEKLAKSNKHLTDSISLKVTESLISTDEKIQSRASKLIGTYGDSSNEELVSTVGMYLDTFYESSKTLLSDFITDVFEVEDELVSEKIVLLSDANKIQRADSFDDLLFFVNQAFDNNEVYDLELLYVSLPKLYPLITTENVSKLEPMLYRAYKCSLNLDFGKNTGYLDTYSCRLINDFAMLIKDKAKDELAEYFKWRENYLGVANRSDWYYDKVKGVVENIPLEKQKLPKGMHQTHHVLMQQSKQLMLAGVTLDLLSTPTHKPSWISPLLLIERINTYESKNIPINIIDFQIAIGRLPDSIGTNEIKKAIESINNKDLKNVFQYHFGLISIDKMDTKPEFLLQSVLSRKNTNEMEYFEESTGQIFGKQIGDYPWEVEAKVNTYQDWDYKEKKKVEKSYKYTEIMMKDKNHPNSTYESIYNNYTFLDNEVELNDASRYMILTPNNLGPICRILVIKNLCVSSMWEHNTIANSIKTLFNIWNRKDYNEMVYLFMATCFVVELKGVREYTAELFIESVTNESLNIPLLGNILSKLEVIEYAPLKRFTDLIVSNMLNISKQHNIALLQLIDSMLSNMNKTPIKGFKKLLELFNELKINQPNYEISDETKILYDFWKETKSLSPIVKKIEKLG